MNFKLLLALFTLSRSIGCTKVEFYINGQSKHSCNLTSIDLQEKRQFVEVIKVIHTELPGIQDWHFENATLVEEIILINNKIREISCQAFVDQRMLKKLNLKSNKLKRLNAGVFDPLVELEELNLERNQLSVIEDGLLKKNRNLNEIILSHNQIVAIALNAFESLKSRTHLGVSNLTCYRGEKNSIIVGITNEDLKDCFRNHENFPQKYFCHRHEKPLECNQTIYIVVISILSILMGFSMFIIVYFKMKSQPEHKNEPSVESVFKDFNINYDQLGIYDLISGSNLKVNQKEAYDEANESEIPIYSVIQKRSRTDTI